jgi:hypothetical protein
VLPLIARGELLGLLSFEGLRASELVVGLIGKAGLEEEIQLRDLESIAATVGDVDAWATALAERYKASGIGSPRKLASVLKPLPEPDAIEARKRLLAVTGGDAALTERLLPSQNHPTRPARPACGHSARRPVCHRVHPPQQHRDALHPP